MSKADALVIVVKPNDWVRTNNGSVLQVSSVRGHLSIASIGVRLVDNGHEQRIPIGLVNEVINDPRTSEGTDG